MWIRPLLFVLAGCGTAQVGGADTLWLKDHASIVGRILAEKADQIAVDVGYTVLVVPRSHVERLERAAESAQNAPRTPPPAQVREDLHYVATGSPSERPIREWATQLGEAVVQVRTPNGLGSGLFLNPEGHLITNTHVIENESQISVEVYHQRNGQLERRAYKQVRIVALHKYADLALLKVEDAGAPRFACLTLGSADALAVGDRVFTIGSPMGLERTVTEGILSTKTREIQGWLYLQTTAPINPGNSGGPLFNLRGQVVGVTNMKLAAGEGIGFAIPVETVLHFLQHRDAFAYNNDNPNTPFRYLEPPSRLKRPQ